MIDKEMIDTVMCKYLIKIADITNKETFFQVFKFITLYRECLNSYYKKPDQLPYTQTNNCEDAPEIANEFISEFLESEENYFGYKTEQSIELTQNFCQWLYDNNCSTSKLTLISQDQNTPTQAY